MTRTTAAHPGCARAFKHNNAAAFVACGQVVARRIELHSRQHVCLRKLLVCVLLPKALAETPRWSCHEQIIEQLQVPGRSQPGRPLPMLVTRPPLFLRASSVVLSSSVNALCGAAVAQRHVSSAPPHVATSVRRYSAPFPCLVSHTYPQRT
jgi:hypothetical protein